MEALPNPTPPDNRVNTLLDSIKASRTKGGVKDKDALSRLKDLKENPDLKKEREELENGVFDRIDSLQPKLNSGINQEDGDDLRFCLSLAYELKMDSIEEVKQYLDAVKGGLPVTQNQARVFSRGSFIKGLVAGVGISLTPKVLGYSKEDRLYTADAINTPEPTEEPPAINTSTAEVKTPTIKPPTETKTSTPIASPSITPSSSPSKTETLTPSPTKTETTTPSPTPDAIKQAEKEAGAVNIAEYLFGTFIESAKQWRRKEYEANPAFAERLEGIEGSIEERKARAEKVLASDEITVVYLGIDDTRERPREFSNNQWGRSDVIMLVRFNPHTLETKAISFPRDLFAPEISQTDLGGPTRINAATMVNYINNRNNKNNAENSHQVMTRILETATGLPIDGIFQTNIDFMQGWIDKNGQPNPGIFDTLFPDGLLINVDSRIVDKEYPVGNYGKKVLEFQKGPQILNGRSITEYARTRHADSDYGRASRQRQILTASMKTLAGLNEQEDSGDETGILQKIPGGKNLQTWLNQTSKDVQRKLSKLGLVTEFLRGDTSRFDKLIEALKYQQSNANMSDNFGIVQRLEEMRNGIKELVSSPAGFAKLYTIAKNSEGLFDRLKNNPNYVQDIGLTTANLIDSAGLTNDSMTKIRGSSIYSKPTNHGNHLEYWKPVRKFLQPILG